jgi:hypothetical protein
VFVEIERRADLVATVVRFAPEVFVARSMT